MRPDTSVSYQCQVCRSTLNVYVGPFYPGVYSGPPDRWVPDEGGEVYPATCPICGTPVDADRVNAQADAQFYGQRGD